MAIVYSHGRNLYFNINAVDISNYVEEVNGLPGETDLGDVSAGGSTGHKWFPGLQKASITVKCIFADNAGAAGPSWPTCVNAKATSDGGNAVAFVYGERGNTATYPKINGNCWVKSIDSPAKVTEPNKFTMTLEVDNGVTITNF